MGLEIAFTRNIVAWPLLGHDVSWFEATDLDLTIPHASRQFAPRDMQDISPLPDASTELAVTPAESLAQVQPPAGKGKWSAAIILSCLLHAGVAAAFLISPKGKLESPNTEQSEGSDQSGDKVVGSALDKHPAAINVTIEPPTPAPAKPVRPMPPKQPSEPTREPTAELPAPSPEPAKQPDILVTKAPHPDDSVVASTKVPDQPVTQLEKPEMSVAVPEQPPIPSARPTPAAPPATAKEMDEKRGTADGQDRLAVAASKGKKQKEAGSAETEFNYRSDVIRKLSRVNRAVPPSVQLTALNNAVVTFVIGSRGGIDDLRILQSSGSPNFDQVALGIVRKAAPFPPIPPQVASKSLVFEAEVGPF
ncbi:energy transducer TonB family protein [Mesorhizobium shangrilense]|uniref:TonB family protein n=1 Tax=Mesorhizobium shangrilense TaxID=460060 RepID=A0ABV2D8M2_9HYPH